MALEPTDVCLVTDDPAGSEALLDELSYYFRVTSCRLDEAKMLADATCAVRLFDCNLGSPSTLAALKVLMAGKFGRQPCLFVADGWNFAGRMQSSLGGHGVVSRTAGMAALVAEITALLNANRPDPAADAPDDVRQVLDAANQLSMTITAAARGKENLPKAKIEEVGGAVVRVLKERGIETWINAVRCYHGRTYRHIMLVTGYAVMFGKRLNLAPADLELLAVAGLLHDIGKVKIPVALLDKRGGYTEDEARLLRKHPGYGNEILSWDGQFRQEVIDAASNHHEALDGSGYPRHLKASQIAPLVRMLTIVDIYAHLSEGDGGAPALSPREAHLALVDLDDRLDQRLVAAFRPVVVEVPFGTTDMAASKARRNTPILFDAAAHPLDTRATAV